MLLSMPSMQGIYGGKKKEMRITNTIDLGGTISLSKGVKMLVTETQRSTINNLNIQLKS